MSAAPQAIASQFAVFLAHNGKEKPVVRQIAEKLTQAGLPAWLDRDVLTPGRRWQDEMEIGIAMSRSCAVCLGPHGFGDWEREELGIAMSRAVKDREYRVFLLLLPGLTETPTDVPGYLNQRTHVDLRKGVDDPDAWDSLLHAITGRRVGLQVPTPPNPVIRFMSLIDLPIPTTPLIGRDEEIARAVALLQQPENRLATLTGPGGIGKTRLALGIVQASVDSFADGVAFVSLAPVSDPGLVPSSIVDTLGIKEVAGQTVLDTLGAYLRDRQMLLLLDNFEQVVEAAPAIAQLIETCPGLKVLATSRAALRLTGEHELPVEPLILPPAGIVPPPETLTDYAATRLFIERAQAIRPDFTPSANIAGAIAAICRRLDGLPLAIELAAARVKVLTPDMILQRLAHRLELLTGGTRDAPTRQQTLRAAIDWSYDLLTADERALFRRLAIFPGGCTLEAAEAVCALEGDLPHDILDGIAALVDHSLVRRADGAEGELRFGMLETIREYASERLDASPEADIVRGRFLDYFLALSEEASEKLGGTEQGGSLARLETEHDNLRGMLRIALDAGEVAIALRVGGAVARFWDMRGHWSDGRGWLTAILTQSEGTPAAPRARALHGLGNLAFSQGDYATARDGYEQSLVIYRELGHKGGVAACLGRLGDMARRQGDYTAARDSHEQILAIYRELGDKRGVATSLTSLGSVAYRQDDYAAARDSYEQSLAIYCELGDKRGIASSLRNLGNVGKRQGDSAAARDHYEQSLAICRELGDKRGIAACLGSLGDMAHNQGDNAAARDYYEQSLAIYREIGDKRGIALMLRSLGTMAYLQGDYAAARDYYEQSLAIRRELGDKGGIAACLGNLGDVARRQGDYAAARAHYAECLVTFRQLGSKAAIATTLMNFALLAENEGQRMRSVGLFAAADAKRKLIGFVLAPAHQASIDERIAEAKVPLGAEWEAAWAAGAAMTEDEAIAYALFQGDATD